MHLDCWVRYSERRERRRSVRRMPIKKVQQSVPTGAVAPPPVRPPPVWVPPRPAPPLDPAEELVEYPSDDDVPMATSIKHALWMVACYRTLDHWCAGRTDVYLAIDLLVYYERGNNRVSVAPDVFVSFGVPMLDLMSYKVWAAGKPPDAVWEFGPPSSVKGDAGEKKETYRRMGVREYWLVDPYGEHHDPRLQGFELVDGEYVNLPWEKRLDGTVAVWSPVLQLEQHLTEGWEPWAPEIGPVDANSQLGQILTEGRLRFWDRQTGKYLELPEEEAERLWREAEQRAERAARAREEAEARAASAARAREEAEAQIARDVRAREEAEARAARDARARAAEMRKTKALEARIAELQAEARGPRDPD